MKKPDESSNKDDDEKEEAADANADESVSEQGEGVDQEDEEEEEDNTDHANDEGEYTGGEFEQLDVASDDGLKKAFKDYCNSLKDDEYLRDLAMMAWVQTGREEDCQPDNIFQNLHPLTDILPVYVEAILGLALEKCNKVSPYRWWFDYRRKIKQVWFAGIFDRLPRKSMDLRMNDIEYYKMDEDHKMQVAACLDLESSWEICKLLVLIGRSDKEIAAMRLEYDADHDEHTRRMDIWRETTLGRLGYRENDFDSEFEAMRHFKPKGLEDYHWLRTVEENRIMKRYARDIDASLQDKGSPDDTAESTRKLALLTSRVLDKALSNIEILSSAVPTLMTELKKGMFKGAGTVTSRSRNMKDEPAWIPHCEDDVLALEPGDALKFETHGKVESNEQQQGRKMRDKILEDYKDLWDNQKLTWTKVPDDVKIEMANRLGKPPLNWHPTVTARRVVNYIGKRRASLKKHAAGGTKKGAKNKKKTKLKKV